MSSVEFLTVKVNKMNIHCNLRSNHDIKSYQCLNYLLKNILLYHKLTSDIRLNAISAFG